jgi:Trk-type K+ transport system membrane component
VLLLWLAGFLFGVGFTTLIFSVLYLSDLDPALLLIAFLLMYSGAVLGAYLAMALRLKYSVYSV